MLEMDLAHLHEDYIRPKSVLPKSENKVSKESIVVLNYLSVEKEEMKAGKICLSLDSAVELAKCIDAIQLEADESYLKYENTSLCTKSNEDVPTKTAPDVSEVNFDILSGSSTQSLEVLSCLSHQNYDVIRCHSSQRFSTDSEKTENTFPSCSN